MLKLSHIRCLLSSSLVFTTKTKSFIGSSYTRSSITRCDWFWGRSLSAMASQYISKVYEEKDIQKSAEDARQYRALELTNDMKVLLVSDPVTDKASAAMDVNVGYFQDPWELPGLAHFCEHMLFLGTEKYKEENEYTKFLNEHGGSSNAYTSGEHTNFYFDVSSGELGGALDRFAQFFTCPLFTASATDREVNAVNSENDKNLQSDPWRLHQLDKSLANPNHDYSKFGTGNKDTLDAIPKSKGINVRDELLNYHSKFYSSNIMGLCVVGKESLDELTEMVVPLFSKVENKKVAVPEWKTHPFGPEEMKKFYYVVPVKDLRSLSMSWSIPDLHPYYHSNPGHYLGHLVGHEGEGSLLSELKTRGWVNTLCGGQSSGAKGFMFFKVDVDLTEDGIEHIDDIITLTCQYINMLRKEGAQEWVFEECQNLSAMTFRFKDKEKPRSYSTSLAGIIHQYPIHEVLCGPYLMTEYRPDLINMVLEKLTPDNMRIGVVAKKYAGVVDKKEKWYETEYKLEDIPEDKLKKWANCGMHENLKLPPRNEFIPTNFEIVARESDNPLLPEMIKESGMTRLWFKQDDKFLLPKACVNFEITSPIAYADPANCNMTYLFVTLFKDALNEYAYDAEIAGLGYGLECTIYGLTLALRGYHEKQHVLLRKVLEKFTTFTVDPKRFEIFKEMYMRGLKNFNAEQPHQHAIYYTNVLMSEVMWTKEELLHSVEDLTADMVQAFIPHLLSKLYIEGLIYGNVTKQKAVEMADMVESIFKQSCETKELLPSQHKRFREVQMPDGCFYLHQRSNQVHKSCSIEIYYQCGMQETQSNMLLELFVQIIGEPCFNILRTQEQLGYIVFTGIRRASGIQGLRVIIQSDRSPTYVDDRVEAFLCYIDKYIEEMAQEAFEKHVTALVAKRMEQPKKISVQNQKFWSEIVSNLYNFDRDNIEVAFLKTIQKDDLYKFFKDNIAYDAPHRHKLSIHIESTAEGANNTTSVPSPETNGTELSAAPELPQPIIIEDISEFKRDRGLYPLPKPFIDLRKAKSKL